MVGEEMKDNCEAQALELLEGMGDSEDVQDIIADLLEKIDERDAEIKKLKEYKVMLEAWHNVFGTTQLTHAIADFEDKGAIARGASQISENLIYAIAEKKREVERLKDNCRAWEETNIESVDRIIELNAEVEKLKQGICEHVDQDVINAGCTLCNAVLNNKLVDALQENIKMMKKNNTELRSKIESLKEENSLLDEKIKDEIDYSRMKAEDYKDELFKRIELQAKLATLKAKNEEMDGVIETTAHFYSELKETNRQLVMENARLKSRCSVEELFKFLVEEVSPMMNCSEDVIEKVIFGIAERLTTRLNKTINKEQN